MCGFDGQTLLVDLRAERPADYHAIAELNALAFATFLEQPFTRTFVSEFALIDALRHGPDYDPDLALVAEVDGEIAGHAFFYPFQIYVGGEALGAVSLGPIAVHPQWQRRGIGGSLIEEGHRRAREKGFAFAFLLGHPSYYPRFGYQTRMFGECRLEIERQHIPPGTVRLEERLVEPGDIAPLVALWRTWFQDVDLALYPGNSLMGWITHTERIMSLVLTEAGRLAGYLRYSRDDPGDVKLFLARDRATTLALLAHLNHKCERTPVERINLPLHPGARTVQKWLALPYTAHQRAWNAAMIKILDPACKAIVDYCAGVLSGERTPGNLVYPPFLEFV